MSKVTTKGKQGVIAMQEPLKTLSRYLRNPRVPQALIAQSAPVAEPPTAPIRPTTPSNGSQTPTPTRPTRPPRAPRRSGDRKPADAPSLLPARRTRTPTRLTPVLFFVAQTLLDMIAIASAYVSAYWLRFESDIFHKFVTPDRATYLTMLGVTVATVVITFYFSKLYNLRRGTSRFDEFYRTAGAVSMGTVLSLATNSLILGDKFIYSRQILLMGWMMAIVFVTALRVFYSFAVGQMHKRGIDRSRVLVVGTGPTAAMVIDRLEYHRALGYQILGVVDEANGHEPDSYVRRLPVLGDISHLREIVRTHKADEVIVALSGASDRELRELIGLLQDEEVSTKIYPDAFQLVTEYEVSVGELSGLPLLTLKDVALQGWNRILKRAFDIVFSALILIFTAPLMLLIAAAIKLTSPGPVFFIQERVGLDGHPFPLVKFRTMRLERAANGNATPDSDMPGWTIPNDPRRTSLGIFLRRFSLDELPQFYNVLIGEMSVVGPRPEQPHYVQEFAQRIPDYIRRHREKAGITGWAQVNHLRGHTPIEWRTAADLYYVENWSLLFDLKIIARTVVSMFKGENAY